MKKRITGLALVLVLLFAFSAWATPRLRINTSRIADVTKGDEVDEELDFDQEDLDKVEWTCDPEEAQGGISFANGKFTSEAAGKTGSYTFKVTATGTYTDANEEEKTIEATRTYTIRVKPKAPGDIVADGLDGYDLDELIDETNKAGMLVNTDMEADKVVFKTTATLPVTYTVTGLPAGIKAEFDNDSNVEGDTDSENNVEIKLSGKPTRAGVFSGIMVTVKNNSGTSKSGPYTLRVFEKAKVTTKKIPDITWGKEYSFKLAASGGFTDYPVTWDTDVINTDKLTAAGLTGFTFDAETGTISGTLTTADKDNDTLQFLASRDKEIKLSFAVTSPLKTDASKSDTVELPITVKAVAPTITNKGDIQGNFDDANLTISNTDGKIAPANTELEFECSGPGTITWSVSKLPDGFESVDATEDDPFKIKVADVMAQTIKRFPVSVTAKNGAGSDSVTFYMNVDLADGDKVKISYAEGADKELPEGIYKVGDSADAEAITTESEALPGIAGAKAKRSGRLPSNRKEDPAHTIALYAYPGPITWSASGLPAGMKLSVDKSVSFDTKAYLTGSFTKETKKDHTYTITAANRTFGTKDSITKTITVYAEPQIKTNALPQYTIGSNYNGKINVTGLDASVDVAIEVSSDAGGALPASRGAKFPEDEDEYYLTFDKDKMAITGMLDKFPGAKPTAADKYILTLKATITAENPAFKGENAITKEVPIKVKGIAPRFMTSRINDFEGTGENADREGERHIISLTGTQPITVTALITAADAKKLSLGEEDITIDVTDEDASGGENGDGTALPATKKADGTPIFTIKKRTNGSATELLVGYAADQGFALAGIPLTITADNGASDAITKVYKVGVTGASPAIYRNDALASKDITVEGPAGTPITAIEFAASGDKPLEFSTNPKIGTKKNGLEAVSADGTLTIQGTPTAGKETSTVFTVTLTNPQTKKKYSRKVTIRGLVAPTITSKGTALTKEIEIGKTMNFKLAAKGSKTITWSIDDNSLEKISNDLGLSFDAKTGTIRGTATGATKDTNGLYSPLTVKFKAHNAAGDSEETEATIGVKGKKPKMMTKTIIFQVQSTDKKLSGDATLMTDILTTDKTADVKWGIYGGKTTVKPLEKIKVATSTTDRNYGVIDVDGLVSPTDIYATKGATLKVSADNIGTAINGNVKIVIRDPAPAFKDPVYQSGSGKLDITANKTSAKTGTVTFEIEDWAMTGDTGMKWAISTRPTGKVTAAIKPTNKNKKATVTVTVGKGLASADISAKERAKYATDGLNADHFWTVVGVTATNTSTNASTTYKVSIDVTPYDVGTTALPAEKDALPEELAEDKELAEETAEEEEVAEEELAAEEEELAAGEGTVTYGRARTESGLTQAERKALSEGGYIIAAILPEITTDESGQYDLDVVSLDEAAAEGAELVWFAFPRNAENTEDDSIAEFYDEAGAEIYAVPESKKVVVSPWLEAEVTYAPVIAVKAPLAGDAKTSLDEAEAGDTVTEQAIENAAETPAEK